MAENIFENLRLIGPELCLVFVLLGLFLSDAIFPSTKKNWFPMILTAVGCLVGAVLTCKLHTGEPTRFFADTVASDGFAAFFRYLFFFTAVVGLYIAYGSKEIKKDERMDFALLLVCVTFGMNLTAIASHLLVLYLGIETISIVSFVMAGFRRNSLKSNEASFKYLIFGALSSGIMLYGLSLLYGFTGSLYYHEIGAFLASRSGDVPVLLNVAMVMIYAGLAFKISAFPMHFWTPDVYEGAPTPVATFFSVGPKAAGFAALMRITLDLFAFKFGEGQWQAVEGVGLVQSLAILAAVTMTVGNLSAIGQNNVKRMLAYSSIAHVGYLLMGLVSLNSFGIEAVLFYFIAYCTMNLGAFWVVSTVKDMTGEESIEAFRGLGWTMPVLGVCMAVFLFSLAGIPLFSGFVGKFLLFGAVVKTPGFLWLALVGIINSVVSLFYYVKILKSMWLDKPDTHTNEAALVLPTGHSIGLVALAVPTVVLGLFFGPALVFIRQVMATFLN